jgi:phosphate transport system permease protein
MTASTSNPPPRAKALPSSILAAFRSWQPGDWLFALLCRAAALFVIAVFVALVSVLTVQAWLAIRTIGISFFTTVKWDPEPTHRQFGALAFIYGTVATSAVAMLIAVPLGVGTAAFLSEIAPPRLRRAGSFLVEMLAAIPSVVYGFWGLYVLAPALQWVITAIGGPNQGGVGIVPAGIILSIMIVPYVSAVSFDVCQAVPNAQREGAYALGATRWQTIRSVVLPYARPGIVGSCFLALGRALGETMAVTMMIGNKTFFPFGRNEKGVLQFPSPFDMGNSIASVIANEFTEATYDLYLSALVELGLVLLLVTVGVNSLARLLIWRVGRQSGQRISFFNLLKRLPPQPARTAGKEAGAPSEGQLGMEHGLLAGSSPAGAEISTAPPAIWNRPADGEQGKPSGYARLANQVMTGVLGLCLTVTVGCLMFILGYLLYRGTGALNWAFFTNLPAPVGELGGGMANALYGSFVLVGLASAFAVPIGVLTAIYLAEYRRGPLASIVRFIGELLAGVPSIVIGIFGYYLVVKPMGHFSGWAGAFALGVIMLPIVMRATEEALRLVPASLRHASYALGARKWQTVLRVTVPAALPSVITAVFLAVARVVGETAPLILTAFSNSHWPRSPNDAMPSLPYFIYNYAVSPYEDWHRQAWAAALVLLAIVMVLSFGVRAITGRRAIATRQAG